ncbi:MAG: ATP-binding protein [Zoogloea sp.]|uniref:ATP-binding protein n=1 Tax=Zoogloea sp. TaxID=49181 RepID=UPI00262BB088|nr:ATP-binding protein [Zoogloea sp.]MDD3326319.1 ATP-binding protein [Zoogloea sp.]
MDTQAYPLPSSLFPLADALSNGIALHRDGKVLFANKAFSQLTGYAPEDLARLDFWALFPPEVQAQARSHQRSDGVPGAARCEALVHTRKGEARWVELNLSQQAIEGVDTTLCSLLDITDRKRAEEALRQVHADLEAEVGHRTAELQQAKATLEDDIARREGAELELLKRYAELTELNCLLHETQQQLVQSEKLASIGQLAAGVAHEINNPIGYVSSNIRSLDDYITRLFQVLDAYQSAEAELPDPTRALIGKTKREADFDYLRDDIHELIRESAEGTERVRKIVQDLRDFSRSDTNQQWQAADLHMGLDSTLNIASNEIKYRADVVREYGALPLVECLPSQLNQVFMNLFVNAAQSIPDGRRGTLRVRTGHCGDQVWIEVEDDGCGMQPEVVDRIFDPFFTTKPVGKGTGLGLSLSYGIIQKHHGKITASSTPGNGTLFRITLPVHQPAEPGTPE